VPLFVRGGCTYYATGLQLDQHVCASNNATRFQVSLGRGAGAQQLLEDTDGRI
jgi:hypothetical protein